MHGSFSHYIYITINESVENTHLLKHLITVFFLYIFSESLVISYYQAFIFCFSSFTLTAFHN